LFEQFRPPLAGNERESTVVPAIEFDPAYHEEVERQSL
jgi:hypothetical protein